MAPRRKSKVADEKTDESNPNNSREIPKMSTPVASDPSKTPKVSRRIKNVTDRTPTSSLFDISFSPPTLSRPSSSRSAGTSGEKEAKCSFYRVERGEDGKYHFSKSLLKYFMTCDSPEMADLKAGRRNTSFLREIPRDRDIQIFTPEEDSDPKYFESVPHIVSHMPEIPGTQHADALKSIPINGDSDEDLKLLRNESLLRKKLKAQNKNSKKRVSLRCKAYKGQPLPEESLLFDYTGLFDSDSSNDMNEVGNNEVFDTKVNGKKQFRKGSNKKKGILHSLLSSPDASKRPYRYNNLSNDTTIGQRENEKLLLRYKDILGNKELRVILKRLPKDQILLYSSKKKVKFTTDLEGKKIYGVKKHADKTLIKSKSSCFQLYN